MAKVSELTPFILQWEGGFVNDPDDLGGATNKGVTLGTWRVHGYDKDNDGDVDIDDLVLVSSNDVEKRILKPHYWDRWRADEIKNQSVANLLVDWVWASGMYGIKRPQKVLGVPIDGIVGPVTIAAINKADQRTLFDNLIADRKNYVEAICQSRPRNKKFRQGWLNRINALKFVE